MTLVAITAVRNEVDVIEPFVRHTLVLCDRLIVMDTGSTDRTPDVLDRLVAEGLPLNVISEPVQAGLHQQVWINRLMALAVADHGTDWVVPVDADEFIEADDPGALRRHLEATDQPLLLPWLSHAPTPDDDPAELNPVLRITHRLVSDAPPHRKVVVPRHAAAGGRLTLGAHHLEGFAGRDAEWTRPEDLGLAHLPVRSPVQYAKKVAVAELQWMAMGGHRGRGGMQSAAPFADLLAGWDRFLESYHSRAQAYLLPSPTSTPPGLEVAPVHYRGGPLRYVEEPPKSEPWTSILAHAAYLADQYWRVSGEDVAGLAADTDQRLETAEARITDLKAKLRKVRRRLRRHEGRRQARTVSPPDPRH